MTVKYIIILFIGQLARLTCEIGYYLCKSY